MLKLHEKIIYSALVNYSIKFSDLFYEDGNLDLEYLKEYVNQHVVRGGYGSIKLIMPTVLEMSSELHIPRSTLHATIKRFRETRLIEGERGYERIKCHKDLFDNGFLSFPSDLKLTNQLMVFYALLEYRSRPYGGIIDTHAKRLAELFGWDETKTGVVYDMLYKLHKQGFVQRLPNNKLRIVPFSEAPKREEASQPSP